MKLNGTAFKSRRMQRREARKAKKQKRQEYYVKRGKRGKEGQVSRGGLRVGSGEKVEVNAPKRKYASQKSDKSDDFECGQTPRDYDFENERKERDALDEEMKKQRIENLKRDNAKEEKEIRKYEKMLKFRKGKRSANFALEGLDYILDVCDRKLSENEGERTFLDSDSEFENDLFTVTGKKKAKLSNKREDVNDLRDKNKIISDKSKHYLESIKDVKFSQKKGVKKEVVNKGNSKKIILSSKPDFDFNKEENNLKQLQKEEKKDFKRVRFAKDVYDDDDNDDDDDDDNDDDDDDNDYDNDDDDDDDDDDVDDVEGDDDDDDDNNNNNVEDDDDADDEELIEAESRLSKKKIKLNKNNAKKCDDLKNIQSMKFIKNQQKSQLMELENLKSSLNKEIPDNFKVKESSEVRIQDSDLKRHSYKESEVWEDIYGKLRDKEGNVIDAYKPPHIRKIACNESDNKNKEKLLRLKRQLKGLLNRLAENNMASISNQIEELYMNNSRNDMNATLQDLFSEAILVEVLIPERLIIEHAMLVSVLHANVGSEVGAYFLQFAVAQFDKLLKENPGVENKHINNLMLFIMHLYNFQIFNSKLLYDMIYKLLENLQEKQIELVLLTLRTVGFSLRKDDPVALKSLILKIQEKANANRNTEENYSRMRFMLEIISAIRNNNVSKIPNYDPEYVEHLKKCMKVLVRKGNYKTELNISLQDLLNVEERGRWWVVGSAWSGSGPNENSKNVKMEESPNCKLSFSQKLLDLAKKQRMNTDARRNIFCILMSAEDYLDAFEKLMKLGLKGAVEREIVNVLLHCALHEKEFNPYYFHLANKFCIFDRKFQIMIQYSIWDKVKELNNLLPVQIVNLAKFVGNIILSKGLPLSVLKVIQFSEMDKTAVKFMRQVLLTILMADEGAVAAAFSRIATSPKLKVFRDGVGLFLHHFLLKNIKGKTDENSKHLIGMIGVADNALTSADSNLVF